MGGHDDSGSSEKKSIGVANGVPTFNAKNMQNNMKAVYYCRTFMCIIGGVVAGILGFTGLTGFIFYFLVMAITSVGLIAKTGFSIHSYYDSWNQIIFDGILGGLMVHFSINFQYLFQVGKYFVRQDYCALQRVPNFVHQFYNEASTMLRIDGNSRETATAMLNDHDPSTLVAETPCELLS
ncbi:ER membrane protein complex subunit 6 [Camellia lanceoleosa]|uniref:ER membrane protein complex subunit 6 n=1 Tax=Camellia lanceoleosa TaxID=1840588 RepID=A0ACC0HAB7_9ERIC|nr:ER membrane protein complex subunit 6 [Camellia lanceoleosa]